MPRVIRASLLAAALLAAPTTGIAQARQPSLLISPAELSQHLRDPRLVLLYVGPKPDYDAGHVPGARLVDMGDLAKPRVEGELSLELPDEATLRSKLESLGIGDQSLVVVVPGEDWGSPATRVMFTLSIAGLGEQSRLLDGGSKAWKAAGYATNTDVPPTPARGRLTVKQDRSRVVDFDFMKRSVPSTSFKLIDARDPIFYEGPGMHDRNGMNHDAGHIPGAVNVPFSTLFTAGVTMLPIEELRKKFDAAGVKQGDEIVAYCHIGQQATMVVFAARLLGHSVRLYDGSFTEWETKGVPIVNDKKPAPKQ